MVITICIGSSCHLKGTRQVVEGLQELVAKHGLKETVELTGSFCMGDCVNGVCVKVNGVLFSVQPETLQDFFRKEILEKC